MSKEWFQHYNIAVKLRNALDDVVVGQALDTVFAGLETGECTVKVTYNGETAAFLSVPKPEPVILVEATPIEAPVEAVVETPKPRGTRKRRTQREDS